MNGTEAHTVGEGSALGIGLIRDRLARARKTWRLSESAARCCSWVALVLGTLLLLALMDNVIGLPGWIRLTLAWGLVLGAIGALAVWVFRPAFWRINDEAAAVYWERKSGEKENLLINAVQLDALVARDARVGSASMVGEVVEKAAERAGGLGINVLWEKQRLKKLAMASIGAVILIALYVSLLPEHAANAFHRYARPLSGVPPLSETMVVVDPVGEVEVLAGERLTVNGLAYTRSGPRPSEAVIVAEVDGEVRRIPMSRSQESLSKLEKQAKGKQSSPFKHEFLNVTEPFSFYVASGDGRSHPCKVKVRERPGIEDPVLELTPPSYTGLKTTTEPSAGGLIHALYGSMAKLIFKPTIPLSRGKLELTGGGADLKARKDGQWEAGFKVEREGPYALTLTSKKGVKAERVFEGQVLLRADALPSVAFETRTANIPALPGATVPLAIQAQDDFGLKHLRLIIRKQEAGDDAAKESGFRRLKAWSFQPSGPKSANELHPLKLDPAQFAVGATYAVYAEAADHCPKGERMVRSAPLLIRVLTSEQMGLRADSPFASIFDRIQKLIELQTKARGKTVTVREFFDEIVRKNLLFKRFKSIRGDQDRIKSDANALLADINAARDKRITKRKSRVADELKSLIEGPMSDAIATLNSARSLKRNPGEAGGILKKEEKLQNEILHRLTSLLGSVAALDQDKPEDLADLEDDQDAQRLREKLEEAKEKVKDFIQAQKKIIKSTQELEDKEPEDLTEEDKEKLGQLAKEEEDWAKYFREKFTDLSKVPDQDFSNSNLAQEFNEVFQEIQKAAEELQDKNVEIAVANEEAGLELAEKLETNLEKWLPDTKDTQKWNMEEPQGEFDVPLADLPEELEDIIGELIDDEEEMGEDVEDVSSSWMDSLDKGAGWDAADGNISNMSAKGVTGNRLPNEHEIGGRSGEGRSGKSHGQFVEESADGKGGRQTPSRNTQDPYEEGQVDDKSEDAIGGATGGGKSAGGAAQGLRGKPPPETAAKLERLKGTQAALRQKAEKISTQLRAYHLPSSDMDEAVRRMKLIEQHLKTGRGFNLRQAHSSVIDRLKEAQKVVGYQGKVYRERARNLPKHVRNKILSGMRQKAPKGYEDLLEAYYKALVEKEKE